MKLKDILKENGIDERINQIAWERIEKQFDDLEKSFKLIEKVNKGNDKRKELMITGLTSDIINKLNNLKSDIYDKARNIPPDIK